jgi:hypothetical protein
MGILYIGGFGLGREIIIDAPQFAIAYAIKEDYYSQIFSTQVMG